MVQGHKRQPSRTATASAGTKAEAKDRLHKELDLHSNTTIELREVADGRLHALLQGHKYAVRAAAFSPDGKTLATGSDDASIKLWDVVTGLEKCTLKGHTDGVLCLAFSNDGNVLVSGGRDGTMRIWQSELVGHEKQMTLRKGGKHERN